MDIVRRFFEPPEDHFFLLGPRGTGKTWLVKSRFPDSLRVDLLDPETLRSLSARPERLREMIDAHKGSPHIVIDEVQKLPELLELVHWYIEEKRGHQFILTGSSARKLRRSGINLLGGRAANCTLHPFMAAELGDRFELSQALHTGLLPVVLGAKNPDKILSAYNGLYLKEEVQAESMVRNVGQFARFLEGISFSQASVLNIAALARESEVSRKCAEGYLQVLEDLLLGFRVPVFTKRAKRATAVHPKFFFFDAGVYRSNRPSGPLDSPSEIDGAALEGLVAQHLRAWCEYSRGNNRLYYWQTRTQSEVDFIIYGAQCFLALEVKNSARIRQEDLGPLKRFGDDYPECQRFFLYRGKERLLKDGILCIPCEIFLKNLKPNQIPD